MEKRTVFDVTKEDPNVSGTTLKAALGNHESQMIWTRMRFSSCLEIGTNESPNLSVPLNRWPRFSAKTLSCVLTETPTVCIIRGEGRSKALLERTPI